LPVGQPHQDSALTFPSGPQACAMSPRFQRALPPPRAIGTPQPFCGNTLMPLSSCAASPRNRTPALSSVCSRAVRTAPSPMCADYESRRESRWRPASGHLSRSVRRCGKPGPIFVVQGPHKVAEVLRRKEQARRLIFGELNDLGPMLRPFGDRLLHQGFQHERRGAHIRDLAFHFSKSVRKGSLASVRQDDLPTVGRRYKPRGLFGFQRANNSPGFRGKNRYAVTRFSRIDSLGSMPNKWPAYFNS
jgi:hypothetical protein